MIKLLDTTFLIHYWGGRDSVADYLREHNKSEFLTTTLNIKELAVGRALQHELDPFELRSTFGWLSIQPFQFEHALIAGELEADLRRNDAITQGQLNSLTADLLIAAVAKSVDATVVTCNTDDFDHFTGVNVESY